MRGGGTQPKGCEHGAHLGGTRVRIGQIFHFDVKINAGKAAVTQCFECFKRREAVFQILIGRAIGKGKLQDSHLASNTAEFHFIIAPVRKKVNAFAMQRRIC